MVGITAEATIETLADSIAAHPTLAEAVKEAALVALGRPIHLPPARKPKANRSGVLAMRASQLLLPTLRDDPADAEAISHKLMVRAGLVRQLAAGIYVYLPLGLRVIEKVNAIIRQEMNGIGGQEIAMPVLLPAEIWQQSGRWDAIGGEMFRLKDRNGRDMCLGMTHEEVIAWLAAREIRSYRDLPQIWYQIQTKERDEARPRSGVLRTREFLMKDSYTLDPDAAALEVSYHAHKDAYGRIFDRCGVTYVVVQSDPGMMGGSGSHEFMAPSAAGEDDVALCEACGYAANVELARGVPSGRRPPPLEAPGGGDAGRRTIEELAEFLASIRGPTSRPCRHDRRRAGARPGARRPRAPRAQAARAAPARDSGRPPRRGPEDPGVAPGFGRAARRPGRPSSPTSALREGRTWWGPTSGLSRDRAQGRRGLPPEWADLQVSDGEGCAESPATFGSSA